MFGFHLFSLLATIAVLGIGVGFSEEEAPRKLNDLRASWEAACERDTLPITQTYQASLVKLRDELTRAEKLTEAVAVSEEIKSLEEKADEKKTKNLPKGAGSRLIKLRKNYDSRLTAALDSNNEIYRKALQSLKSGYAKAGDLNAALAVTKELDLLDGKASPESPAAADSEVTPAAPDQPEKSDKPKMADKPEKTDTAEKSGKPMDAKELREFLKNTRWKVKDGFIDFLPNGKMKMPWHPCLWEVTDKGNIFMVHSEGAWKKPMVFSEDMTRVTVWHEWKKEIHFEGVFSEKLD